MWDFVKKRTVQIGCVHRYLLVNNIHNFITCCDQLGGAKEAFSKPMWFQAQKDFKNRTDVAENNTF